MDIVIAFSSLTTLCMLMFGLGIYSFVFKDHSRCHILGDFNRRQGSVEWMRGFSLREVIIVFLSLSTSC